MRFPYMPPNLSEHGGSIDNLMWWVHALMALLFVGWGAFFAYTLVRYRASRNPKADYAGVTSHVSSWLEGGVAVFECVLLFGLSIPLWAQWVEVGQAAEAEDPIEVRVIAQQFRWNIHYPGPDGKFGPLKVELIDNAANPLGLDRDHPDAEDDIVAFNNLVVPVNRPVQVQLTTKDVIHSFFLPVLRVKQDAIPGESIPIGFTATQTSMQFKKEQVEEDPDKWLRRKAETFHEANPDEYESVDAAVAAFREDASLAGELEKAVPDFEIACAQLCGGQHYSMVGKLHIVSQEEWSGMQTSAGFNKWVGEHLRWQMSN